MTGQPAGATMPSKCGRNAPRNAPGPTISPVRPSDAPRLPWRPPPCRHPDREPARRHAARPRDPGRGRCDRLRGHPRHPQAARPLRHNHAAHALPRAQRRSGAAEAAGPARRRRRRGAGLGRRHAADFRSRLQAGSRRPRRRPCRDRAARRVGHAGGAGLGGTADRPFLLRGLPAGEGRAAAQPHRRARAHSGDA